MIDDTEPLRAEAAVSKAWPFEEARKLVARYPNGLPAAGVLFETGYGPSGLPHIGTFQEVARTTMVRRAFELMCPGVPTRLIAFSDDMDGLRKVPGNVPNPELLEAALGRPLTAVPDPFGTHASFGAHNNARLRAFLDRFGFDYEFVSATECYRAGRFDAALRTVLDRYDAVIDIVLPTLGPERRATYSPFLPVSPVTGIVLQVPLTGRDPAAGTIRYVDPATGTEVETSVTGGHAKLQWKVDWAMRWAALGVDYEMAGKDLIDSVTLSSRITKVLGGRPPEGFNYELFLDEAGQKISKSKGNGISIDQWLDYASADSLSFYIYREPRKAKKLHFDVIPKAVDELAQAEAAYAGQSPKERLGNPAHHVHGGAPPAGPVAPVSFQLLLNLAGVTGGDARVLEGLLRRRLPDPGVVDDEPLAGLITRACNFHQAIVAPTLSPRAPDAREAAALVDLSKRLEPIPDDADAETLQAEVYAVGKAHGFEPLRDWFRALYETLLGQSQGPRMGSFIQLYGVDATRALIADAVASASARAA